MTASQPTPTAFYYNAKDKPTQPELRQALTTASQALRAAIWAVPGVPEAEAALHRFDGFRTHVLEHARGGEVDSIASQLVDAITNEDILTADAFLATLADLHHREQLIAMTGSVVDVMGGRLWQPALAEQDAAHCERRARRSPPPAAPARRAPAQSPQARRHPCRPRPRRRNRRRQGRSAPCAARSG